MYASSYAPENQPIFYFKGHPVRLPMLLVIIHSIAMLVQTVMGREATRWLSLSVSRDLTGAISWPEFWQWATYPLAHLPSFWFIVDMVMLWLFGRALEEMMGRKFLLRLYLLLMVTPLVLVLGAVLLNIGGGSYGLAGPRAIHFSLFMGVAFLHPDAPSFFGIKIKFLAAALFIGYLLQYAYSRDGFGTAVLVQCTALTYFMMRRYGLTPRFERVKEAIAESLPRPRRKELKAGRYEPKMVPRLEVREDRRAVEKVDAILEKISRTGMDSLTPEEKRELERASSELKRQDG